ncbi:MAG: hypothetical protein ACLFWB_13500, partial [Armatimonadota bacterium]
MDRAFTYRVPQRLVGEITIGSYVLVPFGKRRVPGYVTGFADRKPSFRLKDIISTLLDQPVFDERQAELAEWISERYMCAMSDALGLLLPPGGTQKVETTVHVTQQGREALEEGRLDNAPRQRQVLAAIPPEGIDPGHLYAGIAKRDTSVTKSSVSGALGSLQERGYVERDRHLKRPSVSRASQQVVRLVECDTPWEEVLEELSGRAPRQFETIEQLLACDDCLNVADLSRSAVRALVDKGLVEVSEEVVRRAPDIREWTGASHDFLPLTQHQQD